MSINGYLYNTVPLKTNTLEKKGSISAVINLCRCRFVYDILLLLNFVLLWRFQALCGGKCQVQEESRNDLERGISSRLLAFPSGPFSQLKLKEKQVSKCQMFLWKPPITQACTWKIIVRLIFTRKRGWNSDNH